MCACRQNKLVGDVNAGKNENNREHKKLTAKEAKDSLKCATSDGKKAALAGKIS